jgi:hypothetical protein
MEWQSRVTTKWEAMKTALLQEQAARESLAANARALERERDVALSRAERAGQRAEEAQASAEDSRRRVDESERSLAAERSERRERTLAVEAAGRWLRGEDDLEAVQAAWGPLSATTRRRAVTDLCNLAADAARTVAAVADASAASVTVDPAREPPAGKTAVGDLEARSRDLAARIDVLATAVGARAVRSSTGVLLAIGQMEMSVQWLRMSRGVRASGSSFARR